MSTKRARQMDEEETSNDNLLEIVIDNESEKKAKKAKKEVKTEPQDAIEVEEMDQQQPNNDQADSGGEGSDGDDWIPDYEYLDANTVTELVGMKTSRPNRIWVSFQGQEAEITVFQQKIYNKLLEIPKGKVTTYKELGESLNYLCGGRAVGGALKNNPFAPAVPCHRVIGKRHNIGGYNGNADLEHPDVQLKMERLAEEGVEFDEDGYLVDSSCVIEWPNVKKNIWEELRSNYKEIQDTQNEETGALQEQLVEEERKNFMY
eukprot:TRINITY_DN3843_c0_g1_i1.p1 TRINITY_DN3843_c0_g1~~TRINITY_DN3843_c0_g1_i1.p1  ORF type:complete len:261 (+),score=97.00 TRINITY_DN3843_c0_g1_i1:105-887(+)